MNTSPSVLDKQIDLQAQTKTPDGMGGFTTVWASVLPANTLIWAAIWPVSATEVIAANASSMVVSHRIRIRYRSILKASWRIKFGTRYFAIVSIINPSEAGKFLDLMVKEAA